MAATCRGLAGHRELLLWNWWLKAIGACLPRRRLTYRLRIVTKQRNGPFLFCFSVCETCSWLLQMLRALDRRELAVHVPLEAPKITNLQCLCPPAGAVHFRCLC
eukprot:2567925-Karenia_brevis.AAC.1